MKRVLFKAGFFAFLMPLFFASCTTSQYRIMENYGLYSTFSSNVQRNLQEGIVEVGYSKEMVFMALGHPDRKISETTKDGDVEVWVYDREGQMLRPYGYNSSEEVEGSIFRFPSPYSNDEARRISFSKDTVVEVDGRVR